MALGKRAASNRRLPLSEIAFISQERNLYNSQLQSTALAALAPSAKRAPHLPRIDGVHECSVEKVTVLLWWNYWW